MLSIRNLTAGYGLRPIIKNVSFNVEAGETVAILGANTAGKSTVIKAICGLLSDIVGEIEFLGQDIGNLPAYERAAAGLVCVPEGRHIFSEMSVYDNLLIGGFHRRHESLEQSLQECFELFPRLAERRLQMAGTLSGGEQQMVAIGRALMAMPKLLLLDEPSHGLAPMMVDEVHSVLEKINKRGIAVLLIEQNVASALKIVDRGYVFENGQIVLSGTTEELRSNGEIRRTYLGI